MPRKTSSKMAVQPAAKSARKARKPAGARRGKARSTGRIITFYSYKGGTGRTMALANVAWILASAGRRVLVIDWDLEAPGLHQYFRPFLSDPDLAQSDGLIDFFVTFSEAARLQEQGVLPAGQRKDTRLWYEALANLRRYAIPLTHSFSPAAPDAEPGSITLVPAGRQGGSYSLRIETFDWTEFYEQLGGGVFLEAVKQRLRKEFDYILIDSRTGLSDTAGICTVQMPDDLVMLFTLNRQSIFGAAFAARSASEQRRGAKGETRLRIWPVPTRVDPAEHERLAAARAVTRQQFSLILKEHLDKRAQDRYWTRAEIPYRAFYAYEEILATIGDMQGDPKSMLAAMERLTHAVTGEAPEGLPRLPQPERVRLQSLYSVPAAQDAAPPARLYLSYAARDFAPGEMAKIASRLESEFGAANVVWDAHIPLASQWVDFLDAELDRSDYVLFFIGPGFLQSKPTLRELHRAKAQRKALVPIVLAGRSTWADVPEALRALQGATLDLSAPDPSLDSLVRRLRSTISAEALPQPGPIIDPDDPQKHRWGGRPEAGGRKLSATVRGVSRTWFEIELEVRALPGEEPLRGKVDFHLHPSFGTGAESIPVEEGCAALTVHAYGAFTVGAVADGGRTFLELDLATLPKAPKYFREH